MDDARRNSPTKAFEGVSLDIAQKTGYAGGVDWIMFMQVVVPTVLVEMYERQEHEVKKGRHGSDQLMEIARVLRGLSTACCISLQYEISQRDLNKMRQGIDNWHNFIKDELPS
ncbi:unnamed protein product [Mucor hiemalis]